MALSEQTPVAPASGDGTLAWREGAGVVVTTAMPGTGGGGGSGVLYGEGPPDGGTGSDGETYIDVTAAMIYGPKAGGVWGAGALIQMPVQVVEAIPGTPVAGTIYMVPA